MFELLAKLIVKANLQLTKLGESKFAFFYISEEDMALLEKDLVIAYNLLKAGVITITFLDDSKLIVKPARLEKCIGHSSVTAKPRLMFFHNPNDITSEVKEVTFTK